MEDLQELTFEKPPYKIMHVILNQCLRLNMGKLLFSVFLFSLVYSFLNFASTIPLLPILQAKASSASVFLYACTAVFVFIAMLCTGALLYGLFEITARLIQKKNVTLGFLFIAFKKKLTNVFYASAIFTVIQLAFSLLLGLLGLIFRKQILQAIEQAGLESFILTFVIPISFFALLIIFLPFSFVFLTIYAKPGIKARQAFFISPKIIKGKVFHFIFFLIYAGGKNLLASILLSIVLLIIPQSAKNTLSLTSLSLLLISLVRLLETYKAATRILTAFTLYFFFACRLIQVYASEYKKEEPDENPS